MKKIKFLVIGQFLLATGILVFIGNYLYLNNTPILAFAVGILLGLSLVLNLTFLIRNRKVE